jgi:hypothetical protein
MVGGAALGKGDFVRCNLSLQNDHFTTSGASH